MNLRALIDWGLVYRRSVAGERKDYYEAEKDLWAIFRKVAQKRKEKELNPMLDMASRLSAVQPDSPEALEFHRIINNLEVVGKAAEKSLDKILQSESNILLNTIVKMMR